MMVEWWFPRGLDWFFPFKIKMAMFGFPSEGIFYFHVETAEIVGVSILRRLRLFVFPF